MRKKTTDRGKKDQGTSFPKEGLEELCKGKGNNRGGTEKEKAIKRKR